MYYLNVLAQNQLVHGIPNKLENENLKCGTCVQNKMHNIKFENQRRRAKDLLEIIHVDTNGPHSTSYMGEKYFITFTDDFSKLSKVFIVKQKSEYYNCFKDYVNQVENITNKKVKEVRCDNAKEMLSNEVYEFTKQKGIIIEPCPPYVHELNGTAERYNRSVMDTTRCLLKDANLNNRFWPEAVKAAVYLKNRTLANTTIKKNTLRNNDGN